ncbi:MAG: hypothetical protein HPY67_07495 [Syntrophaceae bacterium]|nr:hypothetical protein [Syntrophaceae bacterium]
MAKKSRTDIMEKLSALKPSEPTRTRGKTARKPAAGPARAQKANPPKTSRPAAPSGMPKMQPPPGAPKPDTPPRAEPSLPGVGGYTAFGDVSRIYLNVYENWLQIIRNCSGMAADCNSIILRSLTYFMRPGRWGRF